MSKKVILTGLRANNDLTIGNYFGALLPIIDMAKSRAGEYQVNLFVPDLHSFTTPVDHGQLQTGIMNNLRIFAAAGLPLDNDDVHIYRQSYVPAHSELTVILNCFTSMGQMNRMTQFKDKSGKLGGESVSVGLYDYPVLMAADILLYDAAYVPVGDDQTQHLEFSRDIAERMNSKFGDDLFTIPLDVKSQHEFFGKDQGLRIMDLQDPAKKMSKSDDSGKGVIFLTDDPDVAKKKIMSATTDSFGSISNKPDEQPGLSNLLQIMALLDGVSIDQVVERYKNETMYGGFKAELADKLSSFLSEFQLRLGSVDEHKLMTKIVASEEQMGNQANTTLYKVQKAVGLR